MSENSPPILSYASRRSAFVADSPDNASVFTVELPSPPVLPELLIQFAGAVFGTVAIVVIVVLAAGLPVITFNGSAVVVTLIGLAVLGIFCWRRFGAIGRLLRFGGMPVRITLAQDRLLLTDPPQWGRTVRSYPAAQVWSCTSEFVGWSLAFTTFQRVTFTSLDFGTVELRVSIRDVGDFHRAIDSIKLRLAEARHESAPK